MHMRTCIHIKKLQMAADMEASMFSMFSMFNMQVHVCVCVHVCVHACACVCAWDAPHTPIPTPTPIHPSATPRRGDPRNQLKFDNT